MVKIEDRDFFDLLHQQWAGTTGAADTYWMPEEDINHYDRGPGTFNIFSVDKNQAKRFVASLEHEVDADFITAVHGCLGDLVRRMHDALDEADRLDKERDESQQELFRLALENEELRQELQNLQGSWELMRLEISDLRAEIGEVTSKLLDERGYSAFLQCDIDDLTQENNRLAQSNDELQGLLETARSKAADTLWKIERPM